MPSFTAIGGWYLKKCTVLQTTELLIGELMPGFYTKGSPALPIILVVMILYTKDILVMCLRSMGTCWIIMEQPDSIIFLMAGNMMLVLRLEAINKFILLKIRLTAHWALPVPQPLNPADICIHIS